MAKYIIQDSHEVAECLKILDAFVRAGAHYLANADWGCEAQPLGRDRALIASLSMRKES